MLEMNSNMILYINTIKYLKLSQIYSRLSNRIKRELYKKKLIGMQASDRLKVQYETNFLISELDFNQDYLNRFELKDILKDQFTFINIKNKVDLSEAWNNKELQHLWRYNLHYFEYLFKLAFEYSNQNNQRQCYDKVKYFVENWINNNSFPYGDGWHPYTISLRLTNWILIYQAFKDVIKTDCDFDGKFRQSIYLQYQYLQKNLEKDVLGNHYFENIKALIIGSIFFIDNKVKEKFKKQLLNQLDEQILKDGMHFELSPMYHKIILEDLIKITYWLKDEDIYSQLVVYIQNMIDVTYSLEEGFGKTPAFNDSADGISKNYNLLLDVCKKYFNINPKFKSSLADSGFYIIQDKNKKLIFDTGEICPNYLPAHAHCDALSFELSINSLPSIVNSGTYRYEKGEWRDYFRSTKAHNTVMISDEEQSQFWSSFRVAKRITNVSRKQFDYKGIQFYSGAYVSYLGAEHKRYIGYIDEDKLIVLDYVKSESKKNIKSFVHFVPGVKLETDDNTVLAVCDKGQIKLTAVGVDSINIEQSWYSEQFNVKEESNTLTFKKNESSKFFGYLIDISSSNCEVFQSENQLKVVSDKELIINYDELEGIL